MLWVTALGGESAERQLHGSPARDGLVRLFACRIGCVSVWCEVLISRLSLLSSFLSYHRGMRTTLIDWLLQVHLRYHMLPETLWIAVNIVDRFLSARVVSLIKLQLVGVTAMFIAAKYEEILAPR